MRFKVLAGDHQELDGRKYVKGDVVDSDQELDRIFVNKFERLDDGDKPRAPKRAGEFFDKKDTDPEKPDVLNEPAPGGEKVVDHGEDVTDKFPVAAKNDLKVFKDHRHYRVVDASDQEKVLNSDEEFTRKDQVEEFLENYAS